MIIVIDDLRTFRPEIAEGKEVQYYRTYLEGDIALMDAHERKVHIDQLWLDHDLGWDPVIRIFADTLPIAETMAGLARSGDPVDVDQILIHSSNPSGARRLFATLSPFYDCQVLPAHYYFEVVIESGDEGLWVPEERND